MSTAKNSRKSGFNVPTYGTLHPKGTKIKKNPDGTITLVEPDEKKKKSTKKK